MRNLVLSLLIVLTTGCGVKGGAEKLDLEPQLDTGKRMRLVESQLRAGNVREALANLDQVIAEAPDNPKVWLFYGQQHFTMGHVDEAERGFRRAIELDPYLTDARIHLAAVYQETARWAEAERQYDLARENAAYPRPELIYLGYGLLYRNQGRLDEAEDSLRQAVGINPKFSRGHFELAGILEEAGELSAAVDEYRVAEPGYRNSADYHYRIGLAYFRLGDRLESRQHLERAVDLAPGSPVAEKAGDLIEMMR